MRKEESSKNGAGKTCKPLRFTCGCQRETRNVSVQMPPHNFCSTIPPKLLTGKKKKTNQVNSITLLQWNLDQKIGSSDLQSHVLKAYLSGSFLHKIQYVFSTLGQHLVFVLYHVGSNALQMEANIWCLDCKNNLSGAGHTWSLTINDMWLVIEHGSKWNGALSLCLSLLKIFQHDNVISVWFKK